MVAESPEPYNFVVLYCNFRSLAFFGFIGFLNKAAKSLVFLTTLLSAAKISPASPAALQGARVFRVLAIIDPKHVDSLGSFAYPGWGGGNHFMKP